MTVAKTTFAVFFGNRGFFPASLQAGARAEIATVLKARGHKALMLDAAATRHGAISVLNWTSAPKRASRLISVSCCNWGCKRVCYFQGMRSTTIPAMA